MPTLLAAAATESQQFAAIDVPAWAWGALVGAIVVMLLLDLLLVHRKPHAISFREAAIESAVWVALGLSFVGVLWWWQGPQAGGEYLAGYLIEKSLSVDNVFVWAVLFSYFAVPAMYQFRVLFWGIFGALVMRAIFIFAGVALLEAFDWILYVFGAFLLYTAFKIARHSETEVDPESNPVLRLVRRAVPSTNEYDGQKLFTRQRGKRLATPLFTVLVLVEATDVVFAVDSVPAILAISREPFIVFAANAFAILGLRAMYFLLAGMADRFRYLHVGLGVILGFVGVKMLLANVYHLPTWASLAVIAVVLTITVVASLRADRRDHERAQKAAARSDASDAPDGEDPVITPSDDRSTPVDR
jgi:tellurite resistance protein TerC